MELESGKEVVELAGAKPLVAVGVPAFNEDLSIARVVLEAQKYADRVVVCDDGSSDLTGEIAFILIGLFAVFTAITLYAISRLMQKTNKQISE